MIKRARERCRLMSRDRPLLFSCLRGVMGTDKSVAMLRARDSCAPGRSKHANKNAHTTPTKMSDSKFKTDPAYSSSGSDEIRGVASCLTVSDSGIRRGVYPPSGAGVIAPSFNDGIPFAAAGVPSIR